MSLVDSVEDLPLLSRTPDSWAERGLSEPLALLNDHAFLEKKAAANALDLLNRWPEPVPPDDWATTLASVAHDEAAHLSSVLRLLIRRGGRLERNHRNPYANALRALVRSGRGNEELVDRLLISALIEARSCERFLALARGAAGSDRELARFYNRLGASELGHYRVFLLLAGHVLPDDQVQARWRELLEAEAAILAVQTPGPRMHSGA
ncbi:tRNA isopentenyl-2-thiomethyl-A-37 hydroxylase MiaE [Planctomyces sp. SH-PL62]|uniref:tRNA isopentenyl-2-thiomethyl-A-37 hydroxylase MiaE n=1 Tax=Planctomyces sp. SH-PL62 TaxID=1636152 RepID=UPI00078B427E|nr:tRNA isopentenyl-2-thiomethyl-A-37 hydroxylase MiaE [Planctomyces sp. SH-PL62]AMV40374.1 tRNA-(MS[2]IO[6]A)-hydroxylase (MiaE) [Planctomyces sp. SH-PL62]